MGIFFSLGEQAVRPGVYQRYENTGGAPLAGALNGVVATIIRTASLGTNTTGEYNKIEYIESPTQAKELFGTQGNGFIIDEIFAGGASLVKAVCIGGDPSEDPSVGDYEAALTLLEAHKWNVLCVDTDDTEILGKVASYMDGIYKDGKMGFAVIGEPTSVTFAERLLHAAAYNDYKIVYVGNGWVDAAGNEYSGYKAAARIAGMVASTPASESVTRKVVRGGVDLIEHLTNSQYKSAIESGMICLSTNSSGQVWLDSGVTTLVNPDGNDDAGWKKIKRAKIRFELMQRASDTVEPLIGNINNDANGRATVLQNVQGVLNAMVAERKLAPGAIIDVDTDNLPQGDNAWFVIWADDVDSLEKIYFNFKFRFNPLA